MKTVLTIAGSDSIGGAGIQADLKTMCAHKVYGMTAITAITAQNTIGVQAIHTPPPDFLRTQLDSIFTDICPNAVKIGMLANQDIIKTVIHAIHAYHPQNIVLDPVMISTSNHRLLQEDAITELINGLLPLANVITPNLPETAALAGWDKLPTCREDMLAAAKIIANKTPAAILIKGGHLENCADDLLWYNNQPLWFNSPHLDTKNTHGTGCTLSSAIAANLALGHPLPEAIRRAKDYITRALRNAPCLGHGNGPLNHFQECLP